MENCQPCLRTANLDGLRATSARSKSPALVLPEDSHPLLFNPEEPKSIRSPGCLLIRLKNHPVGCFSFKGSQMSSSVACFLSYLPGCQRSQPSAFKPQRSRTARGKIKVVRHQNRSKPVASVQPFNQVKDHPGCRFVQVARRFVGQQQPGVVDQRPSQRHPLLLAARKFAGPVGAAILQTHLPQPVSRHCQRLALRCVPRASSGIATFSSAVNSGSR